MSHPGTAPEEGELVVPFIVCESEGGPFDTESFVHGFEVGRWERTLDMMPPEVEVICTNVHDANLRQLDLIAMHHRWHIEADPDEDDKVEGWTHVHFVREQTHMEPGEA